MSPIKMSKVESSLRIVLAFNEAFNRHDVPSMIQLMSDDCTIEHTEPAPDGTVVQGKEAVELFLQEFISGSPEARMEIEELFGYGERCIARWRFTWLGLNRATEYIRGVDIFRVRKGLIKEKLSYTKSRALSNENE